MKGKLFLFIAGILFIVTIGIQQIYKKNLLKRLKVIENSASKWDYQLAILDFFEKRLVLPPNLDSLISYLTNYEMDLELTFIDPYLSNGKYLHYIPLLDSSDVISGYALLSAGPDKRINNNQNTLKNSQLGQLELYNNTLLNVTKNNKFEMFNLQSTFLDRVFGKKDIGIFRFYTEEYYRYPYHTEYEIDSLLKKIWTENISKSGVFRSSSYRFKIPDGSKFLENDGKIMTNIEYGEYLIVCTLVKQKYSIERFTSVEGMSMLGILKNVDVNSKIVEFTACYICED